MFEQRSEKNISPMVGIAIIMTAGIKYDRVSVSKLLV